MRSPAVAFMTLLVLAGQLVADEPAKQPANAPDPKALAAPIAEADKRLPTDNDFVVHEWGTFTSFSGSAGVSLVAVGFAARRLQKV